MTLTPIQKAELAEYLKGKRRKASTMQGIDPSPTITAQYYRALLRIVRDLTDLSKKYLLPVLEATEQQYDKTIFQDDYKVDINTAIKQVRKAIGDQLADLESYANRIATVAIDKEQKFHRKKWIAEINRIAGVDLSGILKDQGIEQILIERVQTNVDLIKTIPDEYLENVTKAIWEGVNSGNDLFSIRKEIEKIDGITKYRAKLISRDQMSKLNGALNQFRQQDIGIDSYTWVTSGDERVRPDHKSKNGKSFQWNSPPPDTGHPGQDIQCRCVANPNLDTMLRELGLVTKSKSKKTIASAAVKQTKSIETEIIPETIEPDIRDLSIGEYNEHLKDLPKLRELDDWEIGSGANVAPLSKEVNGWGKSLDKKQEQAFRNWSNDSYDDLRALDKKVNPDMATLEKMANQRIPFEKFGEPEFKKIFNEIEYANIRLALKSAPTYKGTLYRGLGGLDNSDIRKLYKTGNTIELDALSSFSKDISIANSFAVTDVMEKGKKTSVILKTNVSKKAFDISGVVPDKRKREYEVLLDKGKAFKIQKIEEINKDNFRAIYVTLEELD